jgi:hypothetical protein
MSKARSECLVEDTPAHTIIGTKDEFTSGRATLVSVVQAADLGDCNDFPERLNRTGIG